MNYDNVKVKYGLPEQADKIDTGRTKEVGFWFFKSKVPELIVETREQTRKRITKNIMSDLETVLGPLLIEGLTEENYSTAKGKFYVKNSAGTKVASIDYDCGSFVPDSQLEPVLERDAGVEVIVDGSLLSSMEQHERIKGMLRYPSMEWFLNREAEMLEELELTTTYPKGRCC